MLYVNLLTKTDYENLFSVDECVRVVIRTIMSIVQKIAEIEAEMARTQKNKATANHLGMLKARVAKLKRELITPKSSGGPSEAGFDVAKTGDARIGKTRCCVNDCLNATRGTLHEKKISFYW